MIDRENLGVIQNGLQWPIISIPDPVWDYIAKIISRLPTDVQCEVVGQGYHNAGWSYREVKVTARSHGRACEVAENLWHLASIEYQLS
jgi:hypothetical protein